ncbi:MAG: hypothetical protein FJ088_10315, partial [Deltaproteobacteria bacterium]|nr:hypothetical protein [Deltaproteobacteria bacterium]
MEFFSRKKEAVPLRAITLFAVFTFSLITGFLHYGQVFTDYGFFPPADDPPYHLKRVLYIIQNYPYISYFDPSVNFPEGAYVYWHYGFDLALAAISFVFSGFAPSEESVVFISSIAIPVFGAITAVLVFLLAERIAGRFAGIMAALFFVLLPAHSDYSFIGRVDHHVMEPLLIAAAAMFLMKAFERKKFNAILAGLFLGGKNFFFPAAVYFLLIFYAAYGLSLLLHKREDLKEVAIPFFAAIFLAVCAAALTSPFRTSFVFYSPSLLHIAVAFFALVFAVVFYLLGGAGIRQFAIAAGCVATLAAMAFFAAPEFPAGILEGLRYSTGNPMTELSFEAQSLFSDPDRAVKLTGGAVLLFPAGIFLFLRRGFFSKETGWKADGVFLALFVVLLAVSAFFQRRFLVALSPFIAVFAAAAVAYLKG